MPATNSCWTVARGIQILREAGHIDPASAMCLADVTQIPDGLNAAELEKYLREHGTSPGPS